MHTHSEKKMGGAALWRRALPGEGSPNLTSIDVTKNKYNTIHMKLIAGRQCVPFQSYNPPHTHTHTHIIIVADACAHSRSFKEWFRNLYRKLSKTNTHI